MNRRNIDGGHIRLSVLRGVPRGARSLRLAVPGLSVLTVLVVGAALALYWVEVFGPIFVKPDLGPAESIYMTRLRALGEKARLESEIGRPGPVQLSILAAARREVASGVRYSDSYYEIAYPGGDVPAGVGASTDVVVRALRAVGLDLQVAIQLDRKAHPERYPAARWKKKGLDPSIDHRRVANLYVWFEHHAEKITTSLEGDDLRRWHAGDVVMWGSDGRFPVHLGIVSDRTNDDGIPYVVDLNRRDGTAAETHLVTDWLVRAHFRIRDVPELEPPPAEGPIAIAPGGAPPVRPGGAAAAPAVAPQPPATR
jgi:uncharacterized protein YijF (DUF1287 family)